VTAAAAVRPHPALPDGAVPDSLRAMSRLVSPFGLVSRVTELPVTEGEPEFAIFSASLGNPGEALDVQQGWTHDAVSGNFDGAGGALDRGLAAHLSVAESLERYSSTSWDPAELVWATAEEMGEDGIAPARFPRCSDTELADPRSGLVASDPRVPLRWVRGWSLTAHRPVHVPAAAVYLRFPPESPSERFLHPVSTGCAVHTDAVAAVENGILEVVERDAIALTWLQRLRLPELVVDPDDLAPEHRAFWERGQTAHVRTRLFDATTDLGIPVVYGVQLSDHDPVLAQVVAATCDPDPGRAVAKLAREAASLRIALRSLSEPGRRPEPATPEDTLSVVGGALLAGTPDRRALFDFLLEGDRPRHRLADLPSPPGAARSSVGATASALPWLLERLSARGCDVVVVDLTTDEAREVGATVVRVLVPQLMPLSFAHRARYLAHPRLYEAPAAMGHPVHPEAGINPHPQPFA
jgi:ribosomal protein S12 methylthiotransferase accessory factor